MASDRDLNYFAGPIKYKKNPKTLPYTSKFEMERANYFPYEVEKKNWISLEGYRTCVPA